MGRQRGFNFSFYNCLLLCLLFIFNIFSSTSYANTSTNVPQYKLMIWVLTKPPIKLKCPGSEICKELAGLAQKYNISLLWPHSIMVQDNLQLVYDNNHKLMQTFIKKYHSNEVMVIKQKKSKDHYVASWFLSSTKSKHTPTTNSKNKSILMALQQGISWLQEENKLAKFAKAGATISVTVEEVTTYKKLLAISNRLKQLNNVQKVKYNIITRSSVNFILDFNKAQSKIVLALKELGFNIVKWDNQVKVVALKK